MQHTSTWKFAKLTGIFSKETNYKNYSLEELAQMKKIQIYPTKEFVILSDKLKKNIFDVSQKDYENREIIESHKPLILSSLNIYFSTEFKDKTYLNGYDEIIFDACISEQYKGNEFTTPAIIHRAIGGSKTKITIAEQERILKSVKKLATTFIDFDMSAACEKFNYNEGKQFTYSGYLLPAEFVIASIGGQIDYSVIHFLRSSPLLKVAEIKKQLIACNNELLSVPNTNTNENALTIKGYLFRRISTIKGSNDIHRSKRVKKLQPIILLDSLFEQCELINADRNRKSEYRNLIEKILNHFKSQCFIKDWHFEKQGNKFYSIHFTW